MPDTDDDVRFGYYLPDFLHLDPMPMTLRGWATYLADQPTRDGKRLRFKDGDLFEARRITYRYAPATYGPDGWEIPDPPPGHAYHAVAYESGDVWDEDSMGDTLAAILGVLLTCDSDGELWVVFRQLAEDRVSLQLVDTPDGMGLAVQGGAA